MKKQIVVLLGLIFSLSIIATAQKKTVTNADLEKYRQKRLQADQKYRENYERLGMPSPEELEKKRLADEKSLIEFSHRLEVQRLEREAAEAEAQSQALWTQNQYLQSRQTGDYGYQSGGYYYGYSPYVYGYGNTNRSGVYRRNNYSGRTYYNNNNKPTGFFNLQFPPARPPQRILPPRNSNNFPANSGRPRGNTTIRPGRGRN